jgi:hypothetical protein
MVRYASPLVEEQLDMFLYAVNLHSVVIEQHGGEPRKKTEHASLL